MSRTKNWCFTINNYTNEDELRVRNLQNNRDVLFLRAQQECGANGTNHLQGMCCFNDRKKFSTTKNLIGHTAHIEPMFGTVQQAYDYCCKGVTELAIEFGTMPEFKKKQKLDDCVELIKSGKSNYELADEFPALFIRNYRGFGALQSIFLEPRDFKTKTYWCYGSTGTGKSKWCSEVAPGSYWKDGATKWWCGYDALHHTDVIIDDYRTSMSSFGELLTLLDRYPRRVEYKGGSTEFRAKRLFITTPRSPEATWGQPCHEANEDVKQLLRRIDYVLNFDYVANYELDLNGDVVFPFLSEKEELKLIEN
jgi:hypothetical protein